MLAAVIFAVSFVVFPVSAQAVKLGVVKDSILTIDSNIKSIPDYTYKDRTDIKEVRFSAFSKLQEIGDYAFLGCANLKKITLPETLLKLGEGAFRECYALDSLVIPKGVKTLPKALCMWDRNLKSVALPNRLADIGSHAFAYCESLSEIEIPSAVVHIGSNVFSGCSNLKEIELPANLKELESYAFSDCKSLVRAKLPANSNMLGELIFSGCINLRELIAPSKIPPTFDCNSFIFEPDEIELYDHCRLVVPKKNEDAYRSALGWNLFKNF